MVMETKDPSTYVATGLSGQYQETDRYFRLIAEIIKSGLRDEGPDYLHTRGGEYWCAVGNLNLEAVWRTAVKRSPRAAEPFRKVGERQAAVPSLAGGF